MRLGGIFIALCILIIAGCAGAIAYLYLALGLVQAGAVAAATLVVLVVYSLISGRLGFRSVVDRQLIDLSRGSADIARQVAEMGRRLAALESKVETTLDQTRALTDPLTTEIGELGILVKRLAETVAAQQTGLDELQRSVSPADARAAMTTAAPPDADRMISSLPQPRAAQEHSRSAETVLAAIRHAIDENQIDLDLQPVVSLPQRKVRHYESMSRLRDENGEPVPATDFVPQAESAGLMPQIDNLVLFRCIAIVRRLLLKNHEIGLFCNLSRTTLADANHFSKIHDFLAANRVVAPSLVLQFTHAAVRAMGPIEYENLAALFDHGFRFSMDRLLDLRIEPADLAKRGFRFVKIHSSVLLRDARSATETRPSELADLLGRVGIELIADRIETENTVVELLDLDVRYGQGLLFSPPRPVRAEVLQGVSERSSGLTRSDAESEAVGDHSFPDAPAAVAQERNVDLAALTRLASGASGHN